MPGCVEAREPDTSRRSRSRLLLDACGFPPDQLHVVTGAAAPSATPVDHDDVAMITFTGSPDVGWGIKA